MVKLWHVFGYMIDRWNVKTFISKIAVAENEKDAIRAIMLACHSDSFQIISTDEFELEDGMVFNLH